MIVRRFGVLSVGRIVGTLYACIGLVVGGILALFSFFGAAVGAASSGSNEPLIGALFGVGAVVFLPILYGLLGFVVAVIGSSLYNVLAGVVGGVEVELTET